MTIQTTLKKAVSKYNAIDAKKYIQIYGLYYEIIDLDDDVEDGSLFLLLSVEGEELSDSVFISKRIHIKINSLEDIDEWFNKIRIEY